MKKFWNIIGAVVLLVMITNTTAWDVAVRKTLQAIVLAAAVYAAYRLTIVRPRKLRRQQNNQARRTP